MMIINSLLNYRRSAESITLFIIFRMFVYRSALEANFMDSVECVGSMISHGFVFREYPNSNSTRIISMKPGWQ